MYDNDHIVWVLPPDVLLPIPVSPTTEIHMSNIQHITIEKDGHLLAEAVVQSHPDLIDAQLRVEAGHIPPGARSQLVDAVLVLVAAAAGLGVHQEPVIPSHATLTNPTSSPS